MNNKLNRIMFLTILILNCCAISLAGAQEPTNDATNNKTNVFIDRFRRYETNIRNEITQVNFVRDPKQAEIYILMTQQSTGSGTEYTLTFIGQESFIGITDTLKYASRQDDTEDIIRNRLIRFLKMGLVRYMAKTPLADAVSIDLGTSRSKLRQEQTDDKWNYWVFRINADANVEGEEQYQEISLGGGISANRITDDWKINLNFRPEYSEDENETSEETYRTFRKETRFSGLIVKSLTDHWSLGGVGEVLRDTRINTCLSAAIGPAVEYNIFLYSMSTRRQCTFRWGISTNNTKYDEETVFDKTSEMLYYSTLSVGMEIIERWGEMESTLEGKLYFHDTSFNKLDWDSSIDIRLFKGLSLDINARISLIHDQLYIAKGDISIDEILLRRTQLKTNWSYDTWIGFSYLFGSQYNNVVNSRFGGGGGRRRH